MSAKNYSNRIEALLRLVNGSGYRRSDEIAQEPYNEIISGIQCRVPQENFDKFCLYYQGINSKSLQKLIDENYDIDQLIKDLKDVIDSNQKV